MSSVKVVFVLILALCVCVMASSDVLAQSRSLTSRIVVTVMDPKMQPAVAPAGLEGTYKISLSQNISQRIVRAENILSAQGGLPRYTMTEKL